VSKGRIAKYILHLKLIGENIGLPFQQADRRAIEHFVANWLYSQNYSAETTADYIMVLKRFYKFLRSENVDKETPFPPEVRWLKKTIKPNERKQPEFLTPEETESLIKVGKTLRDKTMISVDSDGGFRPGEILLLNVGDIRFDNNGARVTVRGKTGERTVRLISCAAILAQYIETHPFKNDQDAPLWLTDSTNYKNQRVSWRTWNKILKESGKKSGIARKRLYSRMLRHGSATENARFLTDNELKIKYGWSMASRMPGVYVHLSGRDLDDKLVRIYSGKDIELVGPKLAPIACPRCKFSSSPGMQYCPRCATPLEAKEIAHQSIELEELRRDLRELKELFTQSIRQERESKEK
jgi:integrase/recombinase XerD